MELAAGWALRLGRVGGGGGSEGCSVGDGLGWPGRIRRRRFGEGGLGVVFGEAGRLRLNRRGADSSSDDDEWMMGACVLGCSEETTGGVVVEEGGIVEERLTGGMV